MHVQSRLHTTLFEHTQLMSLKEWRKELKKVARAMNICGERVTTEEMLDIAQQCSPAIICECAFCSYLRV